LKQKIKTPPSKMAALRRHLANRASQGTPKRTRLLCPDLPPRVPRDRRPDPPVSSSCIACLRKPGHEEFVRTMCRHLQKALSDPKQTIQIVDVWSRNRFLFDATPAQDLCFALAFIIASPLDVSVTASDGWLFFSDGEEVCSALFGTSITYNSTHFRFPISGAVLPAADQGAMRSVLSECFLKSRCNVVGQDAHLTSFVHNAELEKGSATFRLALFSAFVWWKLRNAVGSTELFAGAWRHISFSLQHLVRCLPNLFQRCDIDADLSLGVHHIARIFCDSEQFSPTLKLFHRSARIAALRLFCANDVETKRDSEEEAAEAEMPTLPPDVVESFPSDVSRVGRSATTTRLDRSFLLSRLGVAPSIGPSAVSPVL